MTDREMIEERCKQEGFTIVEWFTDPDDVETAKLGRYEVTTNEYDDDGLYEGDVGLLTASVVGAAQYHNQRVSFSFTTDGYDEGNEVRDLLALEPTDE